MIENIFSLPGRGAVVAVHHQFPVSIPLDGGTYWFAATKVWRRFENGCLTRSAEIEKG
jgi:hypothetical protein